MMPRIDPSSPDYNACPTCGIGFSPESRFAVIGDGGLECGQRGCKRRAAEAAKQRDAFEANFWDQYAAFKAGRATDAG